MRAEKRYSPLPQPTTNEDKLEVQVPRTWDFSFKTTKVSGKLGHTIWSDSALRKGKAFSGGACGVGLEGDDGSRNRCS